MRKTNLMMIPAMALAASAACNLAVTTPLHFTTRVETRTIKLDPGGQINAATFNGNIKVEGWSRDEVSLVAEIKERKPGDVLFNVETDQGRVGITAEDTKKDKVYVGVVLDSSGVSYTLRVPQNTSATLSTSNGRIEIYKFGGEIRATTSNAAILAKDVGGKASLSTSNAKVTAEAIKGDLSAKTSNAAIDASNVSGGAELTTSNGRIEVRNVSGDVAAHTSNRPILAENVDGDFTARSSGSRLTLRNVLGAVDAATTSAAVNADGLDGRGRGISLSTTNGDVDVRLGRAQGVLNATNSKGRTIKIDTADVQINGGGSVAGMKIGDGGQSIVLKTTRGKITVR